MSKQRIANGNIKPMRFVMPDTSVDNRVIVAATTTMPCGISQQGTRRPPYDTLDDGYAAIAGEDVQVFDMPGEPARLALSGTVAAGDLLKPDAVDGGGITAGAGDKYGARALQAGTSGKIIEVEVMFGELET